MGVVSGCFGGFFRCLAVFSHGDGVTPALGLPLVTVLAVLTVDLLSPLSCSTQVAYVGGSLGALIGADLRHWRRLPELGAPGVSLGGAGTFDGIYITGLVSVLLVLLLI